MNGLSTIRKLEFLPLTTLPEIQAQDDLAEIIAACAQSEGVGLQGGDVLVVTSKIVSKAEGRVITASEVIPSRRARAIGHALAKDPREVEVILQDGWNILGSIPLALAYRLSGGDPFGGASQRAATAVARCPSLLLTTKAGGAIATDGGEDGSNVPAGMFCLLPQDPDASARRLAQSIQERTGARVAVLIADTEIRLLRQGTENIAIGGWGIAPMRHQFGELDRYGKPKVGGLDATADLLTAGAALLMGQTSEGVPVVIVRGLQYEYAEQGSQTLTMPATWIGWGFAYVLWSWLKVRVASLLAFVLGR